MEALARDHWLTIDGMQLEGRFWGPPPDQAPTIVLLHEGLGSVSMWRDFPERLSQKTGAGVFAYSRAGYGRSARATLPRPVDYMHREARDILPNVLDKIGLRDGLLLGHSDGASIAAIYAGCMADTRLKGLCLIAPHFFTEPVGLAAIAQARIAFNDSDMCQKLARYHDDANHAFTGWNDVWLDPEFKDWNITGLIDEITVPVCAVQGRADQYGTLDQLGALARRLKTRYVEHVLDGAHHAPHLEAADAVLGVVADFMTTIYAL